MSSFLVAIVGRPNVGKSTLFNRLVESREAIVDNTSGVTRDRHYGLCEWNGKKFSVVDTGGYVVGSDDVFEGAIRQQVEMALEECSAALFVVDCSQGLTDLDKDFANVLRKSKKPVFLVANKADNPIRELAAAEFYGLGLGDYFAISAISGSGTGDLLDRLSELIPEDHHEEPSALPRITIIGRPNVGKSSLTNTLLGYKRSIVTDIAGTTRDAIDAEYNAFGKSFILTDTAGIRRKSRVKQNIEFYSVLRSIKAIEASDVCIAMIDASVGIDAQDIHIIDLAFRNKKGIVIAVNKWDLVEKDTMTAKKFESEIHEKLQPNDFIPIVFISVLEKQRIFKLVEKAIEVYENKKKRIPTSELNEVMLKEIQNYPPPGYRGKIISIKYITQLPTATPAFLFFSNYPKYIQSNYKRFLENKLREHFNFEGVPITIMFREK